MRRFGESWRKDAPYRDRPGAYAAILDPARGGRLLLAATPVAGEAFLLPGGGVDPGESPLRALHREVMEETGWTVRPLRRLGAFQRYCYMPDYARWARKICHVYLCRPGRRLGPPSEPDHIPVWMPLSEAARALSISGDRWFAAALAARARRGAGPNRPSRGAGPSRPSRDVPRRRPRSGAAAQGKVRP